MHKMQAGMKAGNAALYCVDQDDDPAPMTAAGTMAPPSGSLPPPVHGQGCCAPKQQPQPPPKASGDGVTSQQPVVKGAETRAAKGPDPSSFDIVKAAQYGALDRLRHLVEEGGADVNVPDAENVTLLHWAAINNRREVVTYLMGKGAKVRKGIAL